MSHNVHNSAVATSNVIHRAHISVHTSYPCKLTGTERAALVRIQDPQAVITLADQLAQERVNQKGLYQLR